MGQINSSTELEGSKDESTTIVIDKTQPFDDIPPDPKQENPGKDKNVRNDLIQCVKTRIDMLIEDCLNIKECNEDSNDGTIKVNNDIVEGKSDNLSLSSKRCKTPENSDENESKNGVGSPVVDGNISGLKNEENKESAKISANRSEQKSKSSEELVLKMSDLITEMTTTDIYQQQKKSITTFQTFIDKVLDTSLKDTEEEETNQTKNILKLCNESLMPTQSIEDKLTEKEKKATIINKPESDRRSQKIRPEGKITLKDHIERFLEMSFKAEDSDNGKVDIGKKNNVHCGKNGVSENFNAQGLVNNMITQGIQINKLLSPPLNKSRDLQKSPNLRIEHQISSNSLSQKTMKAEERSPVNNKQTPERDQMRGHYQELSRNEVQNSSSSHREMVSKAGPAVSYGRQSSNPGMHPSSAPSPKSYPPYMWLPGSEGREVCDTRDDACDMKVAHVRDVKDSHELHYMEGRHQEHRVEKMCRDPHVDFAYDRKELHPNYYPMKQMAVPYHPGRPDPYAMHASREQASPSSMLYRSQYSPRSASMSYHSTTHGHKGVPSPGIEQQSPGRPCKQSIDPRDCTLPGSVSHSLQQQEIPEQKSMEHHRQRSPNVSAMLSAEMANMQGRGNQQDQAPAMMRPSHSAMPPGCVAYQSLPQLLPHHPPITSTKEYPGAQLLSPAMYHMKGGGAQVRRSSLQDNQGQGSFYYSQKNEEFSPKENADQYHRIADHAPQRNNYPIRPSSVPMQDHSPSSMYLVRRGLGGQAIGPATETSSIESSSRIMPTSPETPLDLSCKKPKLEPERPRSSSHGSAFQSTNTQKKINRSNTFLKHLENSVDKYCQELNSPSNSPGFNKLPRQIHASSGTQNDSKNGMLGYSRQSPHDTSPHTQYNLLQSRSLPSPHYSGGITLGQPLVDNKAHAMQPPVEFQFGQGQAQSQSFTKQNAASQNVMVTTSQSNFDMNAKRNMNNVSKHEPIQNIIGNHDPNDILYLICRICTQTYGSPYGFRKHFRNQHGFEPRAEHTIVQTISATKSALTHGSVGPMQPIESLRVTPEIPVICNEALTSIKQVKKEEFANQGKVVTIGESNRKSRSASPVETRTISNSSSEDGERMIGQKNKMSEFETETETKCLECPNCGKTFQLNDFGSYKRHCRQHGNLRLNGPYTCSDCHLSFPDHKTLKNHYIGHVHESHMPNIVDTKTKVIESKSLNHLTCFSCVKCNKQFDNMASYSSHMSNHEPELSVKTEPQSSANENKSVLKVENVDKTSEKVWRDDMMLNVIPSQSIVKQAAESMTSLACPDSSWDISTREDKGEETATENSDSGYSSSVGSNSALLVEDKFNEKSDVSAATQLSQQKKTELNSDVSGKNPPQADIVYKHKKFFLHRKRENKESSQSPLLGDVTPSKQMKMSSSPNTAETISHPVTSTSTPTTTQSCDSSICVASADSKMLEKEKLTQEVDGTVDNCSKREDSPIDKLPKEMGVLKPEARHNLPFVCDRTRRGQRKAIT